MGKISEIVADDHFQRRLKEGRGAAETMMVYRGTSPGHSIDDGEGGRAIAKIESCIDEVAEAVGLPIRSATVFSNALRCTVTLRFALGELDDDLAVYHDTTSGKTTFQIIHPDRMQIDAGSQSTLLALQGEPIEVLDLHFAAHDVADVRDVLQRVGLVPVAPTEIRHEAYVLELREA